VVEHGDERDAIYDRVIPEGQACDADKKGVGVLIRVDRIRQGPNSVTR